MKWLVVHDDIFNNTYAINPDKIEAVSKDKNGATVGFAGGYLDVTESFEEIMDMLGNECKMRLP